MLRNMIILPQCFDKEQFQIIVKQLHSINVAKEDNLRRNEKMDMYLIKISPQLFRCVRSLYYKAMNIANRLKITNRRGELQFHQS